MMEYKSLIIDEMMAETREALATADTTPSAFEMS
jgi:hypothetical protein